MLQGVKNDEAISCVVLYRKHFQIYLECHRKPFQRQAKVESVETSVSRDWYGICENCGKKDGLHRFEGKKYCAKCHAKLKTAKKFGIDPESL